MTEPDRYPGEDDDDVPTTVAPASEEPPTTVAPRTGAVPPDEDSDPPTIAAVPSALQLLDTVREPPRILVPPGDEADDTIRIGPPPPTALASSLPDLESDKPTLRSSLSQALAELSGPSHDLTPDHEVGFGPVPAVLVSSELTPRSPAPDFATPPASPVSAVPAAVIASTGPVTQELSLRDGVIVPAAPPPPPPSPPVPQMPTAIETVPVPSRSPAALIVVCSLASLVVGVVVGALLARGSGEDAEPRPEAVVARQPAPLPAPVAVGPAPRPDPPAVAPTPQPPARSERPARPAAAQPQPRPAPGAASTVARRRPAAQTRASAPPPQPTRAEPTASRAKRAPAQPVKARAGGFVRDNPF